MFTYFFHRFSHTCSTDFSCLWQNVYTIFFHFSGAWLNSIGCHALNEHNSRQQARFEGAFIKCIFTNGTWNVHQRSLQCLSLGHMFSFSGTIVQLYNSAKKMSIFCSSFNQSQHSFAISTAELPFRPIHLYLIFEKSSWKNQVRWTGFLVFFDLDF